MDEITERLRNTSDTCIKIYEAWYKNRQDNTARQALQDAIHELRKVASRLEVEVAVSERDQMASQPLPIPSHRANQPKHAQNEMPDNFNRRQDQPGMDEEEDSGQQPQIETLRKPRGRRPVRRPGGES